MKLVSSNERSRIVLHNELSVNVKKNMLKM